MTQTASSPYRDSRTSSLPFWCLDAKGGEGVGVRGRVELERARSYQDFDALYHHLVLVHGYVHLTLEYAVL